MPPMDIPARLAVDNIEFDDLVPSGNLLSVREEWLCELSPFSHRWQIQVEAPMRDGADQFCKNALKLNTKIEKWGPQRAFVRVIDNQGRWIATLSDVSTDAMPIVLAVFDFRMLSESEVTAGALNFAKQQKAFLHLAPLWNELFLSIVLASLERSRDGAVKRSVQLSVDDAKWPAVRSWLEAHRFVQKNGDEWGHQEQNHLFVFRAPGKIWCSLN